jgi:hypothetical protein
MSRLSLPRLTLLGLSAILLGLIGPMGARAAEPAVDDLRYQVKSLLETQRFDALEAMARDLRATDVRVRGGNPQIYEFYRAMESGDGQVCLCQPSSAGQQPLFESRMGQVEAWLKAKPDSYVAHLAAANLWARYAWEARGESYAKDVAEEQWDRMRERLDQAAKHLDGLEPQTDPYAFIVLTNVAQLQHWSRTDIDALYETAIRSYPTFFPLYSQHANLLQTKWFGEGGELAAYVKSVLTSPGGEDGAVAYSYIAFRLMEQARGIDFYSATGLSWSEIKSAYAMREQRYGLRDQDWNALCMMAVWVPDRGDAKEALAQFDGRWDPGVWRTREYYDDVVAWIEAPPDSTSGPQVEPFWRGILDWLKPLIERRWHGQ